MLKHQELLKRLTVIVRKVSCEGGWLRGRSPEQGSGNMASGKLGGTQPRAKEENKGEY